MTGFRHSVLAVPLLFAASVASAQVAESADQPREQQEDATLNATDAFNTIVVTGTKKREGEAVQDVALAVTALDGESLDALNVTARAVKAGSANRRAAPMPINGASNTKAT